MKNKIEKYTAQSIINKLNKEMYQAYYVGGCVRDLILEKETVDYDVVTNATVQEIIEIFKEERHVEEVGKQFGVVLVDGIEVAQYRGESYTIAGKPEIEFVGTVEEDAKRRDFTINSMYMDVNGELFDFEGGYEDCKMKILRAVGNPTERFTDDPSRLLRGIYLAAKLGFTIEQNTEKEMKQNAYLIQQVPNELKGKIVKKSIQSGTFTQFIELAMELGFMEFVFPELVHLKGLSQNPLYHDSVDVWEHVVRVMKHGEIIRKGDIPFMLGLAFHDVAKGLEGIRGINKLGQPNDLGHEEAGVPIAKDAILRLGFGTAVAKESCFYVAKHGSRLSKKSKESGKIKFLRSVSTYFKTKEELRKGLIKLMDFMESDAKGFAPSLEQVVTEDRKGLLDELVSLLKTTVIYQKDLPVDGYDVACYGYKGQHIGEVIQYLIRNNISDKSKAERIMERNSCKIEREKINHG